MNEKKEVIKLGNQIGYGRLMQLASQCWGEKLGRLKGGEFCVGACIAMTDKCGCDNPDKCDWCCGTGWLTKKVKKIKQKET